MAKSKFKLDTPSLDHHLSWPSFPSLLTVEMDDDFTFGASVWGASDTVDLSTSGAGTSSSSHQQDDDQFDDFDDPVQTGQGSMDDDDFGDFGDFGDVQDTSHSGFAGDGGFGVPGPSASAEWYPLRLVPMPSRQELREQVDDILGPVFGSGQQSPFLTDEGIREVEGISQVLVTGESRELYKALTQSPPPTKPPNWTRSKIRRQHLITLGIPVNLDEMLPQAGGKPLPPLEISTRPMSAPPGPRNDLAGRSRPSSTVNSRSGTPQPGHRSTVPTHLGPKPEIDQVKINSLLDLKPDVLTLQPLHKLEKTLNDIRSQTASTSSLLTHLVQVKDALQQDSETYNGLIAELVGEAQRIKSGKPRTSSVRRAQR